MTTRVPPEAGRDLSPSRPEERPARETTDDLPRTAGVLARVWAVAAKDASQELRRRIALASVFFFAATALTLVSYAVGPIGVPAEARGVVSAALLWVILFFSAATGLPRAYVREEEMGTALALRKSVSAPVLLAGKALFNYCLFLAISAVVVPGFAILLEWTVASPGELVLVLLLAGLGLAVVSTYLSALVARASQRNVLFILISFPLLLPLLLAAIQATLEASRGALSGTVLQVLAAYDGASACAGYLLIGAAWEE